MMQATTAVVRFTSEGWHHWPGASDTANRQYLAYPHRHLFHVQVAVELRGNNREVEFHDLLDVSRAAFEANGENKGPMSCEQMAEWVVERLRGVYPDRSMTCSVFEDGEVGACVEYVDEMF